MHSIKKYKLLLGLVGLLFFTTGNSDSNIERLQKEVGCKESAKYSNHLGNQFRETFGNSKGFTYDENNQRYNRCMERVSSESRSNKSLYNAAAEDHRRPDYKIDLEKLILDCDANKANSCAVAGDMYSSGQGTVKNREKAAELYDKGCKLGHMLACGSVAAMGLNLDNGAMGPYKNNPVAAKNLLIKSCDANIGLSCSVLGGMYMKDKDYGKVREYCAKGCSLGSAQGCSWLGMVFKVGLGVPRNNVEAGKYLKMGCSGGHASGCEWYSKLLDSF